jgi:putative spermidine/putrescine transport system permease protein
MLTAAPAVVPVVLVVTGALLAALLQSFGLMAFVGEAEFSTEAWTADRELFAATGYSLYIAAASTGLSVVMGFLIAAYVLTAGWPGRVIGILSAASVPIPHLVASGTMGLLCPTPVSSPGCSACPRGFHGWSATPGSVP